MALRLHDSASVATRFTHRPIVAVTGPDRGGLPAWLFTRRAIHRAGGHALRVHPARPCRDRWDRIDAVVLGGGADVGAAANVIAIGAPGDEPDDEPRGALAWARLATGYLIAPAVFLLRWLFRRRGGMRVDTARDSLELELLGVADRRALPVLGICRGAQLMNIHQGGTLHRDLSSFYVETSTPWTVMPRKIVHLGSDSALRDAIGVERCPVNSLHRHAINEPGRHLRVVARDEDEIIQAVERDDHRFWIGVQWHPEYLPQRPEQRRIFERLVDVARDQRLPSAPPKSARRA